MAYKKITFEDEEYIKTLFASDRVHSGSDIPDDYRHDEMTVYGKYMPELAVEAQTAAEVSALMKYAWQNGIPVTPRGAGTGLCGGAVAVHGGILLSLSKMNRICEIDEENFTLTVEPGATLSEIIKAVSEHSLLYPPDPGEKNATIGGNIMTNAGGMRAIKYGVTRDYVKGMEVVLPNGDIIELGGKVAKNSSGYSIKDLMIGSEGTLGIVTKLILKLIPAPNTMVSLLVPFNTLDECLDAVPKVMKSRSTPTTLEFIQREVIELAETFLDRKFPDKSADYYLLITFDGSSKDEVEGIYVDAAEICLESGAVDVFVSDTPQRQDAIWSMRGAFLEAIKSSTTEMDECDVVVPRNKMADFIRFASGLEKRYGIRIRSFGHAGDGNLHIYVCRDDLEDGIWYEKREAVMREMYDRSILLEGQVSGEHGIGHAKIPYLSKSLGCREMELMKSIKAAFDPKNILNPGKVCG